MNFGIHPVAMGFYLGTAAVIGFVIYRIRRRRSEG